MSRPVFGTPDGFIKRYGCVGGAPVLYFHGAPGAPEEAGLIAAVAASHGVELWAIDRALLASSAGAEDYLGRLAELVLQLQAGSRLPMLGFSIGAALALRVAARLGPDAGPLFLLSAGGPLDLPGAFDAMGAGARVFRAAQADGAGFALTVRLQALMARHWPTLLQRLLFAGADDADRAFAATPAGRATLITILARAWDGNASGYRADLGAYVAPWSHELAAISSPVQLWHGRMDTWAPLAMGRSIVKRLANGRLHMGQDGHYTTLINHAPAALAAALG